MIMTMKNNGVRQPTLPVGIFVSIALLVLVISIIDKSVISNKSFTPSPVASSAQIVNLTCVVTDRDDKRHQQHQQHQPHHCPSGGVNNFLPLTDDNLSTSLQGISLTTSSSSSLPSQSLYDESATNDKETTVSSTTRDFNTDFPSGDPNDEKTLVTAETTAVENTKPSQQNTIESLVENFVLEAGAFVAAQMLLGSPLALKFLTTLVRSSKALSVARVARMIPRSGLVAYKTVQSFLLQSGRRVANISWLRRIANKSSTVFGRTGKSTLWRRIKKIPKSIRSMYRSRSDYSVASEYTYYIGYDEDDENEQIEGQ